MAKIVVLDAFCWIKNTKIDFDLGFAPNPNGLPYTAPPDFLYSWWAAGLAAPSPRTSPLSRPFGPRASALWASLLRASSLLLPSAAPVFAALDR